ALKITRTGIKVKGPGAAGASLTQISLEHSREVSVHHHAAPELAGLAKIDPAERGAVAEPEGEPVAGLAGLVRVRAPHGAAGDQVDEYLDVARGRDRGR